MNNTLIKKKLQRSTRGVEGDTKAVARLMGCTVQTVYNAINAKHPTDRQLDIINALLERIKERKDRQDNITKKARQL